MLSQTATLPAQLLVRDATVPPAPACQTMTVAAVGPTRCATTASASPIPKVRHATSLKLQHVSNNYYSAFHARLRYKDILNVFTRPVQTATQHAQAPASSVTRPLVPAGRPTRAGAAGLARRAAAGSALQAQKVRLGACYLLSRHHASSTKLPACPGDI